MNTDLPFTTHGDEALEARIVAWVLGEASAFEAAELERLCEERPELMVFKRRMLALHGLLAEAENPLAAESWKLPPEKRKAVLDVTGHDTVVDIQNEREMRVKHGRRRALLAIAASLVMLVFLAGLAAPLAVKHRKKSDIIAFHSDEFQKDKALMESGSRSERLRTNLPAELIDTPQREAQRLDYGHQLLAELTVGTPQPAQLPGLDLPASAPARSSTWGVDKPADERAVAAAGSSSLARAPSKPAASPVLMGEISSEGASRGFADTDGSDDVTPRARLHAQLEKTNDRLENPEAIRNEIHELAIKRGFDADDYVDAKRESEHDQDLLAGMKEKLAGELAKDALPRSESQIIPSWKFDEKMAAEEPYSTFSLNISDASFRIAQAALAKGEQPDPAGIKVEQFYNAVDYGDPAPASNEPVACAIEQAAHPVIPGRNLVRVALKTAAAGRPAAQPLRLTLLVDQSGSMTRADRRAAMDKALAGLAGLLTKDDVVSVIGFSRTPRLLADGMTGDQAGKLADLVNQSASEGGTNLEEAMKLADQLAQRHQQSGAQNRIVLFTDGAANLGDADPGRLAAKVKNLRQKGIAFDIAGIAADDLNDALLGELVRHGNGRYDVVGKDDDGNFAKQLAGAFRPAAENVKVQVRFNPERVARYKLIGFEKDRLNTEDFHNDAVDAAELAAEEAGVAIYQIEPLPDGRGEIGEVSVRFRDTAAGEMVERSWTIPHDPAAPALDRAAPSMQLATLAMLAAEKLKGGPLGEAVDFRQFAAAQAEVKANYSGNPRVAEVLHMIEMLK